MRRSKVFVIALVALLLSGCGLVALFANDSRVTVSRLSEGVYQVSRSADTLTTHATRINSSAIITDWEPRGGCVRVGTEVGGADKALKCSASPVKVFTLGTLDLGLVRP